MLLHTIVNGDEFVANAIVVFVLLLMLLLLEVVLPLILVLATGSYAGAFDRASVLERATLASVLMLGVLMLQIIDTYSNLLVPLPCDLLIRYLDMSPKTSVVVVVYEVILTDN